MIDPIYVAVFAAAVVGWLVGWFGRQETVNVLRQQLARATKAEEVSTDRLVHAWKDGATIPPRPSEPIPPPEPLPAELQAELDQWEDGEHRVMLEALMREGLHRGLGTPAILLSLDNLHP